MFAQHCCRPPSLVVQATALATIGKFVIKKKVGGLGGLPTNMAFGRFLWRFGQCDMARTGWLPSPHHCLSPASFICAETAQLP